MFLKSKNASRRDSLSILFKLLICSRGGGNMKYTIHNDIIGTYISGGLEIKLLHQN